MHSSNHRAILLMSLIWNKRGSVSDWKIRSIWIKATLYYGINCWNCWIDSWNVWVLIITIYHTRRCGNSWRWRRCWWSVMNRIYWCQSVSMLTICVTCWIRSCDIWTRSETKGWVFCLMRCNWRSVNTWRDSWLKSWRRNWIRSNRIYWRCVAAWDDIYLWDRKTDWIFDWRRS